MLKWILIGLIIVLVIAVISIFRLYYDIQSYKIQQKELDDYAIEVESIYQQMRGIRHDYRNHLQVMSAYLEQDEIIDLKAYLQELTFEMNQVDAIIRTGNTLIDALVNTKLSRAKSLGVDIDATALAPREIAVSGRDLAVILGNLLNNALEATETNPDEAFIRLYIAPIKNNLYISVTNSMTIAPRENFISLKGPNRQGYGLRRIDQAVAANNGIVNRKWEEGVFATEVTLPLK